MTDAFDDELDELIHRVDLDGLVRLVDGRTATRDWDGLRRARDRARRAVDTGRQVWPVATLAEYRLALDAPAEWAAQVVGPESGRFAIGPLTEVIAQHHAWSDLAPLLTGPTASLVAHERVLRGEVLDTASDTLAALPNAFELPYELAPWEPEYCVATYRDDGIDAPAPPAPLGGERATLPGGATLVDDPDVDLAVRQLVEAWTARSNGHADVASVDGTAHDAVAALGLKQATMTALSGAEAIAWLAWAGASGGAHGRRRGAALGRFGALWTVATLLGVAADWPLPLDELGALSRELSWWWWDGGEPATGWRLQLAVEDRAEGAAWAISARDDA